jgi:hypothetical protein
MKQWDIWSWEPAGWTELHPAVIVSHPNRVSNKAEVNVLMCTSQAPTRPANSGEVILDGADGLDRATLCKCDLLWLVPKTELKRHRGRVGAERQRAIVRTINLANGWV